MKLIDAAKRTIELFGNDVRDENLNRNTLEIIGHDLILSKQDIFDLQTGHPLNPKYKWELDDIQSWHDLHFPQLSTRDHRRHVVYFNNLDFDNRYQCISLFQVIDNTMLIYQRSSDIEKLQDDFRFFAEICKRWFYNVDNIRIFYGSFHTKTI